MTDKAAASQYTSSTQATDFITYARYLVNEPTASFWNDTEMLRWLNEGILNIVARTWCLGAKESITLANDTLEYTFSNDYITLATVHLTDADGNIKALLQGHPSNVGHVPDPGEIVYYYEWDGNIGLYPTMSDVTSYTCSAYQVPVPSVLGTADNSPLPAWFDEILVNFMIAKALFKDNEIGTAQVTYKMYEEQLSQYTRDFMGKQPDQFNTPKAK